MNKKLFVCSILFFGLIFGNQPNHHLFVKKQSVFIPDWRNEILRPNGIAIKSYYSFTNTEIMQVSDSIQIEKSQSDASRITFGKIALESVGAATGGALTAFTSAMIVGEKEFWEGAVFFCGAAVGSAGGATLMGNLLMEPNGSFSKSLVGSTIGTALGSGVLVIYLLGLGVGCTEPHGLWDPRMEPFALGLAALCPITGAVIGYNCKGSGCCLGEIDEQQKIEFCFDDLSKIPFRVQILSIKF